MQTIIWEGIEIDIKYVKNWSHIHEEIYGEKMSHIEIFTKEDLPITETGYKSIFILESNLARWGGVEKYIIDELNHGAKSKEWQFKKESRNQLCLF